MAFYCTIVTTIRGVPILETVARLSRPVEGDGVYETPEADHAALLDELGKPFVTVRPDLKGRMVHRPRGQKAEA